MTRPRYGRPHRRVRAKFERLVAAGEAVCVRCGGRIFPGEPWDLGHVDGEPTRYAGPEHPFCNRSAGGRLAGRPAPRVRFGRDDDDGPLVA